MTDDHELLRSFSENGSEEAFAALVHRHLGLVYHAALRRVGGDRHRAEDAALANAAAVPVLAAATLIFGMNKLNLGIIGALLIAGVTTIALQEHRNRELAGLVQQKTEELKNSLERASAAPGTAERAAEIAALRSRLATLESAHTQSVVSSPAVARGSQKVPLAPGLVPIEKLAGAGLSTPRAALATQLWAAHSGETDLEAKSIALGPKARERLVDLAGDLPENLRTQYDTPEKLMAYLLAGSPHPVGGMEVVSETPQDADNVILNVRWQHEDSDQVNTNDIHMVKSGDQWQMLVSLRLVERAATLVSNH